jgi:hypothetical protein
VGKGKRVDVYLEVRKRRGHTFLNEKSACGTNTLQNIYPFPLPHFASIFFPNL